MKLAINPNPYMRSPRSTFKIMMELLMGLCAIWLCAIIYYFVRGNAKEGIFAIVNVLISVISCSVLEMLFFIPKWRKEENHSFKTLLKKELNSFGYISGFILALLLPVGIAWWQIVLCSVVAVVISKMLFGGFGYNIFNPAIVGRIFASLCFGSSFQYGLSGFDGAPSINAGATVLTDWASNGWDLGEFTTPLWKVLVGDYAGCLGETFTIVLLVIGLILCIRKVIDYRICLSYILMCTLTALLVGLVNKTSNPAEFALLQICTGGTIFGAVFCLTDPVTSPTTPLGKVLFGVLAGFITMLIRFRGSSAEGCAYSILAVNMLTPLIDNLLAGRTTDRFKTKALVIGGISAVLLLVSLSYTIGKVEEGEDVPINPVAATKELVEIEEITLDNMEVYYE